MKIIKVSQEQTYSPPAQYSAPVAAPDTDIVKIFVQQQAPPPQTQVIHVRLSFKEEKATIQYFAGEKNMRNF